MTFPSLFDIEKAAVRIAPYIHRTPVITCQQLDDLAECSMYFKCENFQKIGAFKMRGASNAVFSLSEAERSKGVCTHSSGNHAQALALAAKRAGIPAYIVMPEGSPQVKLDAVAGYGATIVRCANTLAARESTLQQVQLETGAYFIHPFDNTEVICGQATAAMELLEQAKTHLDAIIAPVGGGGLLSGTSLSVHYLSPSTQTYGAEPQLANDAFESLRKGSVQQALPPKTIADGLRTSLSDYTFAIIRNHIFDILTVTEEQIIDAMKLLFERAKIVVEPSGAVPFAVVLNHRDVFRGKKVGIIISGGNVDLGKLPF